MHQDKGCALATAAPVDLEGNVLLSEGNAVLRDVIARHRSSVVADWLQRLRTSDGALTGRVREGELQSQAETVLNGLNDSLADGAQGQAAFRSLEDVLTSISRERALQGFTPTDTAMFIFSLKEPIFNALNAAYADQPKAIAQGVWTSTVLIDRLGLHTMEVFLKSREDVIGRQSQEISELSSPVVRLWKGIVALPLIGTLDSARTSVVMENLLQAIVDEEAAIAIIDITGVPTVDTLTAQHLLKTVSAAKLMGAECLISGIRPQIAQTMVHLGVDLSVTSKATLADAFALALKRLGLGLAPAKRG